MSLNRDDLYKMSYRFRIRDFPEVYAFSNIVDKMLVFTDYEDIHHLACSVKRPFLNYEFTFDFNGIKERLLIEEEQKDGVNQELVSEDYVLNEIEEMKKSRDKRE